VEEAHGDKHTNILHCGLNCSLKSYITHFRVPLEVICKEDNEKAIFICQVFMFFFNQTFKFY